MNPQVAYFVQNLWTKQKCVMNCGRKNINIGVHLCLLKGFLPKTLRSWGISSCIRTATSYKNQLQLESISKWNSLCVTKMMKSSKYL